MEEGQTVTEPQVEEVQDPFSLGENDLVSLTPEQRAGLEPIIENWKKRANEEITKRESTVSEKYKPLEEKAVALDKLVNYQPFVKWWQEQQRPQGANQSASPQQIASQAEWQEAIYEASQGNGEKLQGLQQKMMTQFATPIIQELNQKQQKLDTQLELRDLFESHPDAKDLDQIGLDPKTKEGTSLLEMCLDWAERNGKSLDEGYGMARKWADSLSMGAQQKAMGMVTDKKQSVTQGPSTSQNNGNVVTVGSMDELIKKSLEDQVNGIKDIRYVVK